MTYTDIDLYICTSTFLYLYDMTNSYYENGTVELYLEKSKFSSKYLFFFRLIIGWLVVFFCSLHDLLVYEFVICIMYYSNKIYVCSACIFVLHFTVN